MPIPKMDPVQMMVRSIQGSDRKCAFADRAKAVAESSDPHPDKIAALLAILREKEAAGREALEAEKATS